ncbi:MAG: hypothetical protein DI535_10880 [Citrobacter freundii]|nr:MAG: hypothetical protein DI535_10880 [Citrobacter freundii]
MPYRVLTSDVLARFSETAILLNTIKANETTVIPPSVEPIDHKVLKGLFYVSLYACVEFSFNELCVKTITLIKNKNVTYNDFENKFLTIALSASLQTVRDCTPKKFLDKASDMFYLSDSSNIANLNETFISTYLQNIWGKSFNQLTKTFGTTLFSLTAREMAIFDELVDNRNIVAHGRDLAQTIGSSPKYLDLKSKYDIVFDVINRYIIHFETFFNGKGYIKMSRRINY